MNFSSFYSKKVFLNLILKIKDNNYFFCFRCPCGSVRKKRHDQIITRFNRYWWTFKYLTFQWNILIILRQLQFFWLGIRLNLTSWPYLTVSGPKISAFLTRKKRGLSPKTIFRFSLKSTYHIVQRFLRSLRGTGTGPALTCLERDQSKAGMWWSISRL